MACETYKKLCENIDSDFEEKPAITYSIHDRKKVEEELLALEKLGYHA